MLIDLWFVDRSSRGSVDKGTGLSKWFRFCIWQRLLVMFGKASYPKMLLCQMEKKPAVFPALKRPFGQLKEKKTGNRFLTCGSKVGKFLWFSNRMN